MSSAKPGGGGRGGFGGGLPGTTPPALTGPAGTPKPVAEFAREAQAKPGDLAEKRNRFEDDRLNKLAEDPKADKDVRRMLDEAKNKKENLDGTHKALAKGDNGYVQAGKSGVDLAVYSCNLRNQRAGIQPDRAMLMAVTASNWAASGLMRNSMPKRRHW